MRKNLLLICILSLLQLTAFAQNCNDPVFSINESFSTSFNPDINGNDQNPPPCWTEYGSTALIFRARLTSLSTDIVTFLNTNGTAANQAILGMPIPTNLEGVVSYRARPRSGSNQVLQCVAIDNSGNVVLTLRTDNLPQSETQYTVDLSLQNIPTTAVRIGWRHAPNPQSTSTIAIDDVTYTSACPSNPAAVARTRNNAVSLDATGNATITAQDVDNNSTDQCGNPLASLTLDVTSFDCTNIGDNTVTLTATTTGGETDTQTAIVTVEPNLGSWQLGDAPVEVELDASGLVTADAVDLVDFACPGLTYEFAESTTLSNSGYDCTDVGQVISGRDIDALDASGNVIAGKRLDIIIVDKIAPTLSLTSNTTTVTLDPTTNTATLNASVFGPNATDNCSASVSLSQSSFSCSDVGVQTIQVIAEDPSDNQVTEDVTVTVNSNVIQQTVSTNAPVGSTCADGSAYTITVDGSQTGLDYMLTNAADGSVIDGPISGTGSPIDFNSGAVSETTTFEILAQSASASSGSGSALLWEGQGDYATSGGIWDFDYRQGYTLEFVFNGVTNPNTYRNALFALGQTSQSDIEVYWRQGGVNELAVVHGRSTNQFAYNLYVAPPSNVDVHIAIVFDPTSGLKVFYDGVEQTFKTGQPDPNITGTSVTRFTQSTFDIGQLKHSVFGASDLGQGQLDEVRIWSIARTATEIMANKDACVDPTTSGLNHYYKFDEGTGTTLTDETGSLDLTISGSAQTTYFATELLSCSSTCETPMANTITIGDTEAPVLVTLPSFNLDLNIDGEQILNPADAVDNVSDNCTANSALVYSADITQFTCADLGVNQVTITVEDEAGNQTSQVVDVNVRDQAGPRILANNTNNFGALPPLAFNLAANDEVIIDINDLRATVADNCDANPVITLDKTTFGCADLGTQTITITAEDAQGNQSTATEEIVIRDRTLPAVVTKDITLALDATGNATLLPADIEDGSTDNCTNPVDLVLSLTKNSFNCNDLGTNQVSLVVEDASGNEGFATAVVTIIDDINPVAIAQDITADRGLPINPALVDNGSSDNCSVTLSLDQDVFNTLGTFPVVLTATDPSGNTATATANVTVVEPRTAQTITFAALPQKTFGDADFELAASASSSLPITYTSSDETVATVSESTVTIVGAGTTTITASQAGNQDFAPAMPVSQDLVVLKANQNIVIDAIADKLNDAADFDVVATTDSSLPLDYSVLSGPATINGATVSLTGATGTVEIEVSQAGNNDFNVAAATVSFNVIDDPCLVFAASTTLIQNVSCNGDADGSFEVQTSAGTAPFSYELDGNSQSSNIFDNLTAGNYDVVVTDANQCSVTASISITEPDPIVVTADIVNNTSIYGNGSINLTVTGGSGNYSYSWSNGVLTANLNNLQAGIYELNLTDETGCSITESFTVGGVTSIESHQDTKVQLYPVPATNVLFIKAEKRVGRIEIFDAKGSRLLNFENLSNQQVDVSTLPSGTYYLLIDGKYGQKFLKSE